MNRLLGWILKRADTHLPDEQIIADIESDTSGDLPAAAGRHLRSCWQCLARRQQLQSITFQLVEYQQAILTPYLPPPPNAEERFLRALDKEVGPEQPASAGGSALRLWQHSISGRGAILASACALCVTALLVIGTRPHVSPPMLPAEFLKQAAASDHSLDRSRPGVVTQCVRIQGPGQSVERTLYRDLQGRRHLKVPTATPAVSLLHSELAAAGVDWDDPLSATSFASWHDRSSVQGDEVAPVGQGLLTLTTTVADPEVAGESLTVRQSDFHPIARTVHLRNAGTIEIAELDYSVSGWNAVNDAAFSPAESIPPSRAAAIVIPTLPTPEQLDEAELQARLAIGEDTATSSEALEFSRISSSIRIHGVVGTNERKQELLARLRAIPRVTASIVSIAELSGVHAIGESVATSEGSQLSAAGISPLSALFQQQSRSAKEAASVSRQVMVAMFAAQQESNAITDLLERFDRTEHLTSAAQNGLSQLLAEHRQRLEDALSEEEQLVRPLATAGLPSVEARPPAQSTGHPTLAEASARNRVLCDELISGSPSSSRSAELVATDLLVSIDNMRQSVTSIRSNVLSETK